MFYCFTWNQIPVTFAMGASGTAAVAEDAAADASDFLSRIFGSFLGESVTAAGAAPAEVEGSDAGGPLWDCSGSIFWQLKGKSRLLSSSLKAPYVAMAKRIIPVWAILNCELHSFITLGMVQKLTQWREWYVVRWMGWNFPLEVHYPLISCDF